MGPDDLPVQCVGPWAPYKHDYIRRYIEATSGARGKFSSGPGGAAYIDLFAGPGKARVREDKTIVDGSPLIAASHQAEPFTHIVTCDTNSDNVAALDSRLGDFRGEKRVLEGDCNERIGEIIEQIPKYGLNIALVDPFGPLPLRWDTIKALAQIKRMDLVVNFPTGSLKRNFTNDFGDHIGQMLGTHRWRETVTESRGVVQLVGILREQLEEFGYGSKGVRDLPIRNRRNVVLYHLVFASKHPLGDAIWDSIAKTTPNGQTSLQL